MGLVLATLIRLFKKPKKETAGRTQARLTLAVFQRLVLFSRLLIDVLRNNLGIGGTNLIEEDRDVKKFLAGHRFRTNNDPVARELFGDRFAAPLQGQQQMDLDLGHRLEMLIDFTVSPGAT